MTRDEQRKPIFEMTRFHVRGLRGLQALDLPEQGLGWGDRFPAVALLGGANGSGKTTLLQCITGAAEALIGLGPVVPEDVDADECLIDFKLGNGSQTRTLRFLVGTEAFVRAHATESCYGYMRVGDGLQTLQRGDVVEIRKSLRPPSRYRESSWPRLVYFPSEERDLVVPRVKYKAPGQLEGSTVFAVRWKRPKDSPGRAEWRGTTVELFFSARWADLNAKELGNPDEATHFGSYADAFATFTRGTKQLGWTVKGELVVQLENGQTHSLEKLSSGERQLVLLLAELRRYWRPGSIILIDEPELHLHDGWQTKLYDALILMQQELGGQVLLTTQSHHLFEVGESSSKVLLGIGGLR